MLLYRPPPPKAAELPLTVQSVSDSLPLLPRPPPPSGKVAWLLSTVQSGQCGRAAVVVQAAALVAGVAADGAVGRGTASRCCPGRRRCVAAGVAAGDRQPRDRRADIASTWNTRLALPPLTVSRFAPGP